MGDRSSPDDASRIDEGSPAGDDPPSGPTSRSGGEQPHDESSPDQSPPGEPSSEQPPPEGGTAGEEPSGSDGGGFSLLDELLVGLAIAGVVAVVLFAVSGVWPPLVAVESPSMEPNLYRGDLVFVAEEHRFADAAAVHGTGVVPARAGEQVGYDSFGAPGDVIVYHPDGHDRRTPIIHRAAFWVNDSENWYAKANPEYLTGEDCEAVPNCPAPHAGFVTRGDNNDRYDQVEGISEPVRPSWIAGAAEYKVPLLGRVRLALGRLGPGGLGSGGLAGAGVDDSGVAGPTGVAVAHATTITRNATSIEPVRSSWTTAEPRTPTTA